MFIDSVTHENLVKDVFSDNPKRIALDSVMLFSESMERLPANQWVIQDSYYGYIFFIYVFDQSKVPHVDTTIPGSVAYYVYSGNSDVDTIVFNYHFELKEKCNSITNDTLYSYIDGKRAEFSEKSQVTDVFVIKK